MVIKIRIPKTPAYSLAFGSATPTITEGEPLFRVNSLVQRGVVPSVFFAVGNVVKHISPCVLPVLEVGVVNTTAHILVKDYKVFHLIVIINTYYFHIIRNVLQDLAYFQRLVIARFLPLAIVQYSVTCQAVPVLNLLLQGEV